MNLCPCRYDPSLERTARRVCEAAGQEPDEPVHVPPHPRFWGWTGFSRHVERVGRP